MALKKKYTGLWTSLWYILIFLSLASCRKLLEVPDPKNGIPRSAVFANDQEAEAAARGLYSQMTANSYWITNGGATLYGGLSADELYNYFSNKMYDDFRTNSLKADDNMGVATHCWYAAYRNIYHANNVLDGVAASKKITGTMKARIRGEMLVVRALHYFYLVNLFGDVPLVLSPAFEDNEQMPRTSTAVIYRQLISDLEEAAQLLPDQYPTAGRVRPNRFTAYALLARIYLYTEEWAKAESAADMVIGSGTYHLEPDLRNVFLRDSEEAIWQLMPGSGSDYNTAEGLVLLPADSSSIPEFPVTDSLLKAFGPGDQRKQVWIGVSVCMGDSIYYPAKYKIRNGMPDREYYVVLRLAETMLIRAEARAMQDKLDAALEDLAIIRRRAGLPAANAGERQSLLEAILRERRVELMAEWGHRWLDLKRTKQASAVLGAMKAPGWQTTDTLYPIPAGQIRLNPFLVQNPGY